VMRKALLAHFAEMVDSVSSFIGKPTGD